MHLYTPLQKIVQGQEIYTSTTNENVWGILSQPFYTDSHQLKTLSQLKKAIQEEWENIVNTTALQSLINSIPLMEVIKHRGGHTNY